MAAEQAPPTNPNVTAGASAAGPTVLPLPPEWPGAFAAYKYSKQAVKLNANAVVGWLVVSVLVSGTINALGNLHSINSPVKGLLTVASYLIAPLFSAIITKALIAGVRRQPVGFGQALSLGSPYWFYAVVLSILVGVVEGVSLLLLIIPFFFVWPRLSLAMYFLVDKNLDPAKAFQASWEATKGKVGSIYGILGAEIAMGLLIITIIGIPFAFYFLIMYSAAHAVLYEIIISSPVSGAAAPPVEA